MTGLITGKWGWTRAQEEFLINNAGKHTIRKLAESVGKNVDATRNKLRSLKRKGVIDTCGTLKLWTAEEERFLIDNHNSISAVAIAKSLNRTLGAVINKAAKMNIQLKSADTDNKVVAAPSYVKREYPLLIVFDSSSSTPPQLDKYWTDDGIDWLINNHSKMKKSELAVALGKSVRSIECKLGELRKVGLISRGSAKERKEEIVLEWRNQA